jgi:hypothetical protein
MTVQKLVESTGFQPICLEDGGVAVGTVYCGDLLSVVMSRCPEGAAWVTVIGNKNAVAVAALTDAACVIIAEGFSFDEDAVTAARGKITLLRSPLPAYETAAKIGALL